jgi:transposase-like protein
MEQRGGEIMQKRKRHTAAFKAKVATEAIRGEKTANELAGQYQLHPTQIAAWKKQALEGLTEVFADGRRKQRDNGEAEAAKLYEEIGRLKVERDFLKKNFGEPRE